MKTAETLFANFRTIVRIPALPGPLPSGHAGILPTFRYRMSISPVLCQQFFRFLYNTFCIQSIIIKDFLGSSRDHRRIRQRHMNDFARAFRADHLTHHRSKTAEWSVLFDRNDNFCLLCSLYQSLFVQRFHTVHIEQSCADSLFFQHSSCIERRADHLTAGYQ